MTCPTCRGSGHHPDAPWLLCPEDCEAAERVRERSVRAAPALPEPVPPGEVHLRSGGKLVRLLGVEP